MQLDLKSWGPMTVLAVAASLLLLIGGLTEVITSPGYTFRAFLEDLKWFASAAIGGAAIGRGIRLQPKPVDPARDTTR